MKRFHFKFQDQFDTVAQLEAVMKMSYSHYCRVGVISALMVAIYELCVLFLLSQMKLDNSLIKMEYALCYFGLSAVSILLALCLSFWMKNVDAHGKYIYYSQIVYTALLITWGVCIAMIKGVHTGNYDILAYLSVLLLIPLISFQNPYVLITLQLIGDIVLSTALFLSGNTNLLINFISYACVAIIATWAFQKNKKNLYIKQYELQQKMIRDPLTGILNRQTITEDARAIWSDNIKHSTPVSVIMGDVDYFKKINDKYGHLAGDKCLIGIAKIFESVCDRPDFSCYRFGGEEFIMLLSNCDNELAIKKATQIMDLVKNGNELDIPVTISLGVYTSIPSDTKKLEHYISMADNLLYESKESGRDRYTALSDE